MKKVASRSFNKCLNCRLHNCYPWGSHLHMTFSLYIRPYLTGTFVKFPFSLYDFLSCLPGSLIPSIGDTCFSENIPTVSSAVLFCSPITFVFITLFCFVNCVNCLRWQFLPFYLSLLPSLPSPSFPFPSLLFPSLPSEFYYLLWKLANQIIV